MGFDRVRAPVVDLLALPRPDDHRGLAEGMGCGHF